MHKPKILKVLIKTTDLLLYKNILKNHCSLIKENLILEYGLWLIKI